MAEQSTAHRLGENEVEEPRSNLVAEPDPEEEGLNLLYIWWLWGVLGCGILQLVTAENKNDIHLGVSVVVISSVLLAANKVFSRLREKA